MTATKPQSTGRLAARLDGERSRTRILDAAERLLSAKGYSGTGIAAISRESGLPASSIYWFFKSKRDLMMAVVERSANRFLSDFGRPDEAGRPPSLRALFERGLEQFGSRLPDFLRLRYLLALERGDTDAELRERFRDVNDRIRDLTASAIETSLGDMSVPDAREIAESLAPFALAIANGALVNLHVEPESIELEHLPEELEIAVRAVAQHRARAETPRE